MLENEKVQASQDYANTTYLWPGQYTWPPPCGCNCCPTCGRPRPYPYPQTVWINSVPNGIRPTYTVSA